MIASTDCLLSQQLLSWFTTVQDIPVTDRHSGGLEGLGLGMDEPQCILRNGGPPEWWTQTDIPTINIK